MRSVHLQLHYKINKKIACGLFLICNNLNKIQRPICRSALTPVFVMPAVHSTACPLNGDYCFTPAYPVFLFALLHFRFLDVFVDISVSKQ